MAISNVRFYKLATLPNFDVNKKGIFVHVTSKLIRTGKEGTYNYSWGGLSSAEIQKIVIQKIVENETTTRTVLVPEWMKLKRLDTVESGLWFGGENGWELLSNDTTSGAIDAAINDKIAALDVPGYAQAEITTNTSSESESNSTLTIFGIKEVDGKIAKDEDIGKKFEVAIDGVYNKSSNKIATKSTVTTAINGLNTTETIQAVTKETSGNITTLTLNGVKEENGVIAQGDGATTFIVGDAKLNIQIGSSAATNVFSANATEDSTIKLDGYVFRKNEGDVISVITPTAVASDNRLVTEKDVANLAGAMHYKGTVSSLTEFQNKLADGDAEEAGDVYIATGIQEGSFIHNGNTIENGDMIVFNSASEYKVVQSNITLGINSGQIAKNDGNLTSGNIVVATGNGIKTSTTISEDTFNDVNNKRDLSYTNGDADTTDDITLYHDVTITDALTVIGKPFTKSIKISSANRSIEIAANGNTGVMVDLVWNTSMDPDTNN